MSISHGGGATRAALVGSAGEEPSALRDRLGATARLDPDAGRPEVVRELAGALWSRWRTGLEEAGVEAGGLVAAVEGAGREAWLWAMGERTWAHLVESVAGRIERRTVRQVPGGRARA